jgi:alkylation response protein AidB-like acyl-CoA dehydrogenase
MDVALTDAQRELASAARRHLEDRYPAERVAELAGSADHDLGAWPALDRLGWLDAGLGPVESALLAEESGRALHPAPWLVTAALALPAYHAAGTVPTGPATLADGSVTCRATHDGAGWRLDGEVADVAGADVARELVVAAQTEKGLALFAVRLDETAGTGVTIDGDHTVDPLRGSGDVRLHRAPARPLVESPAAQPMLQRLAYGASLLFAAEGVGVADHALASAIGDAGMRHQFGGARRPFDTAGRALAESYADVETARSLVYRAAAVLADGDRHPGEAVACAVHAGRRAAVRVCENAFRAAGGIGVTWDHPLHWWYRRALWLDAYHAGQPDPLEALSRVLFR